ncbi:MAG: ROK family protein [Clostridia bacterium]|nr:ROK family protein [Clostridia bacterium]
MTILGFDIGGTKCAATVAEWDGAAVTLGEKVGCPTDLTVSPTVMIDRLMDLAEPLLTRRPDVIGISCGGPLDPVEGVILGPPNLSGWDRVEIVSQMQDRYGVPVKLQNDANACAVAEWKFGAGQGCRNMVFLTFGTGLGAGLILDGKLYEGTNGNAGEVGHIRLERFGPIGFGKQGSFEGFCSGGGLAQLGYMLAEEKVRQGIRPLYFPEGCLPADVTAKTIAEAAYAGDETALEVYRTCGRYLGRGLSVIIDLLNPEKIVLGSVFVRSRDLLWETAAAELEAEALGLSAAVCQIVPAALGEQVGDYAAVAAALSGGMEYVE